MLSEEGSCFVDDLVKLGHSIGEGDEVFFGDKSRLVCNRVDFENDSGFEVS
jgi:hypothetical protein